MLVSYDFQGVKTSHLRLADSRVDGEAYNVKLIQGLNKLDELEFQLPIHIINRVNGQQERNWRVDQIMPEQKVRLTFQNYDDYFYVRHIEESHSNGVTICLVRCVHAAEILVKTGLNKTIDMEGTADEVLTTIISGSGWTVGVCNTFMQGQTEKIRHYKKDNSNIMEMLCEIAELFEGYLTFDAVNKQVNLLNNIGDNKGVSFRYAKNLREITRITDTENITTRLWVWGGSIDVAGVSMNVSINEVTDNKNPFLDDWSYYWDYMTQAQKDAITAYNTIITAINGNIQTTQASISDTETDKYDAEQERDTKKIQLDTKNQVKDELTKQLEIEKDPDVIASINAQLTTINGEISTLNSEISTLNTQISDYTDTLTTLNNNLNTYIGQLTTEELTLRAAVGDFIKEGIYKNDQYVDKTALLNDAKNILAEVCVPKVTYNMSVVDLSQLTGYALEKFDLGDIVGITDDLLNIGIPTPVPARIREITKVLDNPRQNTITISNFKGSFEDEYKRISKSAEIVNQRLEYYERAYLGLTAGGFPKGDVLQQAFDNNKFTIVNGTNNKVTYDINGITIEDTIDSNKKIRINSGGIFLTKDGGTTWKVGMSGAGISAMNIVSGVLDTKVIQIWNTEQPKFFWNDKGLYAYGATNDEWIRFNASGLYGTKKANVNPTSVTESDFNMILNWDKYQLTTTDNKGRAKFSVSDGIKFQAGDGTGVNWTDIFSVDNTTGTIKSVGELILKGNGIRLYDNSSNERYKCGDLGSSIYGFEIYDVLGNKKVETRSDGTLKLTDGELLIGSGSSIVKINGTNGILVGGSDASTAKFVVAMDGTTTIKGTGTGITRTIGSAGITLTDGNNKLNIDGGFGVGIEFSYADEYRGGLSCATNIILEAANAANLLIDNQNPYGKIYAYSNWDFNSAKVDGLFNSSGQPYVTSSWVNSQGYVTSSYVNSQISDAIAAHVAAYHGG
jgi:phage minor structural protein